MITCNESKHFSAAKQLDRFYGRLKGKRLPGDMYPEITRNLTTLTLAAAVDAIQKISKAPAARKPAMRRKLREEFDIDSDEELLEFVDGIFLWWRKQQ